LKKDSDHTSDVSDDASPYDTSYVVRYCYIPNLFAVYPTVYELSLHTSRNLLHPYIASQSSVYMLSSDDPMIHLTVAFYVSLDAFVVVLPSDASHVSSAYLHAYASPDVSPSDASPYVSPDTSISVVHASDAV
jgi:hypothetical protein